jgi:hypothetical protein
MCNSKPAANQSVAGEPGNAIDPQDQQADLLKFKRYSYIDQQGTGGEAFSFLIPVDWVFSGGLIWLLDNPRMPVTSAMKVTNPNGTEEWEGFPNQPFWWTTNQGMLSLNPIGSRYFGNEVAPPVGAREAMKQIVLPRFRSHVANLRIIEDVPLPELAQAVGAGQQQPGIQTTGDGAKAKIEYELNGRTYEEEFFCVVESYTFPTQSWSGVTYTTVWTVDYIFSIKAEKGKLEAASPIFQTITYSFQVNPMFYNKCVQLTEYLIQRQIQQIHSIGQLGQMLAQQGEQMRQENLDQWYDRQAVNDRIAENFSDYVRGVDRYYDPFKEQQVELPTGYDNAWVNPLGEYVISPDPSFNPNIGSNLNWQPMQKK